MSKREKFATRTITLYTEDQRSALIALANNLPVSQEKPLEAVIREPVKARGIDQNGYYWMRLGEIAEQAYFNGRRFDSDTWHYNCGREVMPEEITTKDGEVRSKWIEAPDGTMRVISTTLLEKVCFANYTTAVEAFGTSLGVMFSANPRGGR